MRPKTKAKAGVDAFTSAMQERTGLFPTPAQRRAAFYLERRGWNFGAFYGTENVLEVCANVKRKASHQRWVSRRAVKLFLSGQSIQSVARSQERARSAIEHDLRVRLARRSGPMWLRP